MLWYSVVRGWSSFDFQDVVVDALVRLIQLPIPIRRSGWHHIPAPEPPTR